MFVILEPLIAINKTRYSHTSKKDVDSILNDGVLQTMIVIVINVSAV